MTGLTALKCLILLVILNGNTISEIDFRSVRQIELLIKGLTGAFGKCTYFDIPDRIKTSI